ncbi:MAG: biopolymer transporter ExbD [Candidatus Marinimicrobia bacterium]|nr:biopolymer transporter ExbD [Candidatus Neomarinimicrobiota bacterium]
MEWKRKKESVGIPTTAMPDIVFMLIFFFMVSSVLRTAEGLPVNLPQAKEIKKLKSRVDVSYIWVNKAGMISFDGQIVEPENIRNLAFVAQKEAQGNLTVSLRADVETRYEVIDKIHHELRKGQAFKINYSTKSAS